MSPGQRRGSIFLLKFLKFLLYAQKSIVYFTFAVSVIFPLGNSAATSLCLDCSAQKEFACVSGDACLYMEVAMGGCFVNPTSFISSG